MFSKIPYVEIGKVEYEKKYNALPIYDIMNMDINTCNICFRFNAPCFRELCNTFLLNAFDINNIMDISDEIIKGINEPINNS